MKEKELMRRYKFSDADLKQLAMNQLLFIERDILAFNDRGFDATRQDEYRTALNEFINSPTDNQFEGMQMSATQTKSQKRETLIQILRTIHFMANSAYNDNLGKRIEFGDSALSKQSDNDLVQTGFEAHEAATRHLQVLSREGLTVAKLDQLNTARLEFQTAILEQKRAIATRDIKTRERIGIANKVYDLLIRYGALGKNIWESSNSSKYNDYVIYDTPQNIVPDAEPTAETTAEDEDNPN